MTPKNAASLPPELDSLIAQFLSNDGPALRAFVLTPQSWLVAGRPILFRKIELRHPAQLIRLLEILQSSPYLGRYVRYLRVRGGIALPEELTSRLTDLRAIIFVAFAGVTRWDAERSSGLIQLRGVTKVCFHGFHILPSHIIQVVLLLPSLEQLEVIKCASSPRALSQGAKSLPLRSSNLRLKTLRILYSPPIDGWLIRWLRGHQLLRSVSLQLTPDAAPNTPGFPQSLGSSLETLELSFYKPLPLQARNNYSALLSQINFSANPMLRTLQFYHQYSSELYSILSKITSGQIRMLTLHLGEEFRWHSLDHNRLATILASPKFSSLREVRFVRGESHSFTMKPAEELTHLDYLMGTFMKYDDEGDSGDEEEGLQAYSGTRQGCLVQNIDDEDGLPGVTWLWTTDVDSLYCWPSW